MAYSQSRVRARHRSRWNGRQGQVFKAGPGDGSGKKGPTPVTQLQQGLSLDTRRHTLVLQRRTGEQEEGIWGGVE